MNQELIQLIENTEIFCNIDEATTHALVETSRRKEYKAGDKIFSADTHPGNLFIIGTGLVWLGREDLEGRRMFLDIRGRGQHLGAMSILVDERKAHSLQNAQPRSVLEARQMPRNRGDREPTTSTREISESMIYSMDAIAATQCVLFMFPANEIRRIGKQSPVIYINLSYWLTNRLLKFIDQLAEQREGSLNKRIAYFLLRLYNAVSKIEGRKQNDPITLTIKLTNAHIADAVAATESRVSSQLAFLIREEVVTRTKDGFITINKPEALKLIINDRPI